MITPMLLARSHSISALRAPRRPGKLGEMASIAGARVGALLPHIPLIGMIIPACEGHLT